MQQLKSQRTKRQNNTLIKDNFDIVDYFVNPTSPRQKQYEVVRAMVIDKLSAETVANMYGYKVSTIYSLLRDARSGKLDLFPILKNGPKRRRASKEDQDRIINFRKKGYSVTDINKLLLEQKIKISEKTIERILNDYGFDKLKRRTNIELGKSTKNTIIPDRSEILDFSTLEPFNIDCPSVGVFFFIPYIIKSGVL